MTHLEHLLNEAGFDLIRPRGGPARIVYVDRRGHHRPLQLDLDLRLPPALRGPDTLPS